MNGKELNQVTLGGAIPAELEVIMWGEYLLSSVVFPPEPTLYQLHFTSKDHTIKQKSVRLYLFDRNSMDWMKLVEGCGKMRLQSIGVWDDWPC